MESARDFSEHVSGPEALQAGAKAALSNEEAGWREEHQRTQKPNLGTATEPIAASRLSSRDYWHEHARRPPT
jgi:hypothetical protein